MKKTILTFMTTLLMLPLVLGATTQLAAAHVLKEDNGIIAVLHIPPEDNPIAAQTTELDLLFSNTDNTFSLSDCNCQISVTSNAKTIQTVGIKPVSAGATLQGVSDVRFPSIGIYNLIVSGTSKTHSFSNFQLNYLERVATSADGPPAQSDNSSDVVIISGGSLIILIMVAYTAIQRGGRYRSIAEKQPELKNRKKI